MSSPLGQVTAPALRGYSAASATQAPTLSLGRESLSSPRGSSAGASGPCLSHHRLSHQSRGCWELGGLPSSFLTWIALPPTAWQLGPARLPPASWEAPSPHQNCLPSPWAELRAVRQTLRLPVQALRPQRRASEFPRTRGPPPPSPSSFKPILVSNQRASGSASVSPGKGRSLAWPGPGPSLTEERRGSRHLTRGGIGDPWQSHRLPALPSWPATLTCPHSAASLSFSVWSWGALDHDVKAFQIVPAGTAEPSRATVRGGTVRGSGKCCLFICSVFSHFRV